MRKITGRVEIIRNGAVLTTMEYSDPPTINMVSTGEICLSMKGELIYNGMVNFLTDEIKPICIIDDKEYPLGVYIAGTVEERSDRGVRRIYIEAYDRALRMKQTRIESRIFFAKGTKYTDALRTILNRCGIYLFTIDACEDVLITDREDWEIGENYLTIANQLLSEINFYPIWFDLVGTAHLERIADLRNASVDHHYKSGEASVVRPEISSTLDTYDAPNVFVAICDNPELDEVWVATAENNVAASSLSIAARGRRIMADPIKVDNIPSLAALQTYVDNIRDESLLSTETITFYTALMPVHQVNDIVALSVEDNEGVFEETEWVITMGPGQLMTHIARRIMVI